MMSFFIDFEVLFFYFCKVRFNPVNVLILFKNCVIVVSKSCNKFYSNSILYTWYIILLSKAPTNIDTCPVNVRIRSVIFSLTCWSYRGFRSITIAIIYKQITLHLIMRQGVLIRNCDCYSEVVIRGVITHRMTIPCFLWRNK